MQIQEESFTAGTPGADTAVRAVWTSDGDQMGKSVDERVSLAPLTPETALRALLATPREADDQD